MTREKALRRISKLSCAYQHIRMTDCPHCAGEVESFVRLLMAEAVKEEGKQEREDSGQFGVGA